jgi:hypothetical protein
MKARLNFEQHPFYFIGMSRKGSHVGDGFRSSGLSEETPEPSAKPTNLD